MLLSVPEFGDGGQINLLFNPENNNKYYDSNIFLVVCYITLIDKTNYDKTASNRAIVKWRIVPSSNLIKSNRTKAQVLTRIRDASNISID